MTTSYVVSSGPCAHKTCVEAELVQDTIKLRITSTCPHIQKYAEKLKEISIKDISKPMSDNPAYSLARNLTANCAVPCAVLYACWAEAGLISKNLLKQHSTITIEYKE